MPEKTKVSPFLEGHSSFRPTLTKKVSSTESSMEMNDLKEIPRDEPLTEKMRQWLHRHVIDKMRIQNEMARQFLAEFIGTAFLLLIGTAANVQAQTAVSGNSVSQQLAWGFGFMFAVYLSANISGAHLNPAISLMFYIQGDMGFLRMLVYWVAQYLGAIIGSLFSFLGHFDDIQNFGHGNYEVFGANKTAGLFAPYPTPHITHTGAFFDQVFGTAILSAMIILITDKRNSIPPTQIPMLAGVTMSMIAMTFGDNGFSINPARDVGPRIWQVIIYGGEVFSAYNWYFWIPVVGPHVGAPIGAWIYKLFIGLHGEQSSLDLAGDKRGYKDDPDFDYPANPSSGLENLVAFRKLNSTLR